MAREKNESSILSGRAISFYCANKMGCGRGREFCEIAYSFFLYLFEVFMWGGRERRSLRAKMMESEDLKKNLQNP